jgi:hypothetical protein
MQNTFKTSIKMMDKLLVFRSINNSFSIVITGSLLAGIQ